MKGSFSFLAQLRTVYLGRTDALHGCQAFIFLDDEPKYFLRDVTFQKNPLTIMQQFPHVSKLHRQYQKHFFAIIFSTCTELFFVFFTPICML